MHQTSEGESPSNTEGNHGNSLSILMYLMHHLHCGCTPKQFNSERSSVASVAQHSKSCQRGSITWKPMPDCLGYGMPAGAKRGPPEPAARSGRKVKRKNGALGPKNRVAAARPSTAAGTAVPRGRLLSSPSAGVCCCLR